MIDILKVNCSHFHFNESSLCIDLIVGFETNGYSFNESDGHITIALIKFNNGRTEQNISGRARLIYDMDGLEPGNDLIFEHNLLNTRSVSDFTIPPEQQAMTFSFTINDDDIPEKNENLNLVVSLSGFRCRLSDGCYRTTSITIVDNDGIYD